jgi:phosphoglucosamine mutase
MSIFGTSGIRRLADSELLLLAYKVGIAAGTLYSNIVIGTDTRTSGPAIRLAVSSGILAAGSRCSYAGIVPTPTVAYSARHFQAGIMITASHNPPQYNGIKMLNPDGSAFSSKQQDEIENLVNYPPSLNWQKMRREEIYDDAETEHLFAILRDIPKVSNLKVVVDAGCGAAYSITPKLLNLMGCQVISLNCTNNGIFPHDVEPVEANLTDLMNAVKTHRADLGIAHDGDADRMMAVDNLGRFISGDKMLVVLAQAAGCKDVVTTIDASMCIEQCGYQVKRTKVGDPFVSEQLKTFGRFGGEPSGAWVFPDFSLCPDGPYAAAKLVSFVAKHTLSEIVDSIPSNYIIRGNVKGRIISLEKLKSNLSAELYPDSLNEIDGLKLGFKDGWLLVRPSGTEPKIRLTVECVNQTAGQRYFNTLENTVQKAIEENY